MRKLILGQLKAQKDICAKIHAAKIDYTGDIVFLADDNIEKIFVHKFANFIEVHVNLQDDFTPEDLSEAIQENHE